MHFVETTEISAHESTYFNSIVYKPATGPYVVNHNLIRSHAKAYRTYRKEFYAKQQGMLSSLKQIY
jgi:hypothetical protein